MTELQPVRTSAEWIAYFSRNAEDSLSVPWESGHGATPEELAEIVPSLRGWQIGETSDGRHLLAAAKNYSAALGDPAFLDAVKLFIAEEQRHGEALGRFLDLAGVRRATWDLGDFLFRLFRYSFPRMEVWATVVVMVESHAMIYYAAIRRATRSPVLRCICDQILRDEVPHLYFQCERLAILQHRRPCAMLWLTRQVHRFLFAGITLAVWVGHRRALRAGGLTFRRFWRNAWYRFNWVQKRSTPSAYHWPKTYDCCRRAGIAHQHFRI